MAEVVTGEAVVLDVPCARFPSRALALALDVMIQFVLLFVFTTVIAMVGSGGALDPASRDAVEITGVALILVGFPVVWETASRGRSPGKFALGLRVISDDGSPERFRQALVRGLVSVVEIWTFFALPALITSLISARGKRLGDVFAGTSVVRQRLPAQPSSACLVAPPHLAAWAASLELSGLSEQTAETARQFLARWTELRPEARDQLGAQLAAAVSAQVAPLPPAGTPAEVYLSAVLAERRRRDQARWLPPGAGRWPAQPEGLWPGQPGSVWPGQAGGPGLADPPASGAEGHVPPA